MSIKKYVIALEDEQRSKLEIVARSHQSSKRERDRAKILLLADTRVEPEGQAARLTDSQIAASVGCTPCAVSLIRKRASVRGVLDCVRHKEQVNRKARRLDGAGEAQLVTLACSQAPEGRKRWTMQLLREQLIQMQVVESIDGATICRTLKKMRSSPG